MLVNTDLYYGRYCFYVIGLFMQYKSQQVFIFTLTLLSILKATFKLMESSRSKFDFPGEQSGFNTHLN